MIDWTRRKLLHLGGGGALLLMVHRPGLGATLTREVMAVRIWPSSSYTRVTFESSQELQYKFFFLTNPLRLVMDLKDVVLSANLREVATLIHPNDPFLKHIRAGQFDEHTLRLVLELKVEIHPEIFAIKPVGQYQHRLVVDLYSSRDQEDPLLGLLEEFNKGHLNNSSPKPSMVKPGKDKVSSISPFVGGGARKKWVIVLDPGHGGEDPGAVGPSGSKEKNIVLSIARMLKKLIDQSSSMTAYLTREEDVFIPLQVRIAKARKLKADLFISIHADAFIEPRAKGSSVFILSDKGASSTAARWLAQTQNEADLIGGIRVKNRDQYLAQTLLDLTQTMTNQRSHHLASQVLKHIGNLNALHGSQVEKAGFAVLKAPDVPSILVETAFISNPEEERRLNDPSFQHKMAQAIFQAIQKFVQKIP